MNYTLGLLLRLTDSVRNNWLIKTIFAGWLLISGVHDYIYIIFTLVILDVITGVWASINQGKKFLSERLKHGLLEKVVLYMILILVAFAMGSTLKSLFPYQGWYVVFFVTILISSYECVSICENILVINPELKFIRSIITLTNRFSDKSVNRAAKAIDKIELETKEIKKQVEIVKEELIKMPECAEDEAKK